MPTVVGKIYTLTSKKKLCKFANCNIFSQKKERKLKNELKRCIGIKTQTYKR